MAYTPTAADFDDIPKSGGYIPTAQDFDAISSANSQQPDAMNSPLLQGILNAGGGVAQGLGDVAAGIMNIPHDIGSAVNFINSHISNAFPMTKSNPDFGIPGLGALANIPQVQAPDAPFTQQGSASNFIPSTQIPEQAVNALGILASGGGSAIQSGVNGLSKLLGAVTGRNADETAVNLFNTLRNGSPLGNLHGAINDKIKSLYTSAKDDYGVLRDNMNSLANDRGYTADASPIEAANNLSNLPASKGKIASNDLFNYLNKSSSKVPSLSNNPENYLDKMANNEPSANDYHPSIFPIRQSESQKFARMNQGYFPNTIAQNDTQLAPTANDILSQSNGLNLQDLVNKTSNQIPGATKGLTINADNSLDLLKGIKPNIITTDTKNALNAFMKNRSFQNADNLQSNLYQDYALMKNSNDPRDVAKAPDILNTREALKNDIFNTFYNNGDHDLAAAYQNQLENYRTKVVPFLENNAITNMLLKTKGSKQNPSSTINFLTQQDEPAADFIKNQLSTQDNNLMLANGLSKAVRTNSNGSLRVPSNALLNEFSNLNNKGYGNFIDTSHLGAINKIENQLSLSNKLIPVFKSIGAGAGLGTGYEGINKLLGFHRAPGTSEGAE
jgi:hypothetical protein